MPSKRDLGTGYFVGTGLGLILSLFGYLILVDSTADIFSLGTVTALGFAGSLPYLGYWLWQSDLADSTVWAVARWCGIGILVPSVFVATLMVLGYRPRLILQFPHLLVNLVAAGGSFGAVLGLVIELRHQQSRAETLNKRNTLLNLIMRHDIRNDVSVIQGYSDLLAEELGDEKRALLRPIENKSAKIIETSRLAEQIHSIDEEAGETPVDLVSTASAYVAEARETYPEASIRTDLPEEAWVEAGDLLRPALSNLVENAIEHNDGAPEVRISVERADDAVWLRIEDNGPGIPPEISRALGAADEAMMGETPGLGLWLVKRVVVGYGGEFTIEAVGDRGTVVEIGLPVATPAADGPAVRAAG